jgi:FSR family fosmidomycin resistance protein-like MFS transporter
MIGTLAGNGRTAMGMMALVFLYNVLAFGGQLPFGLLLDKLGGTRRAALGSMGLIAAGLLLRLSAPALAVVLAGLGSAIFHVAGGAATLRADEGKAAGPGLFAAPGVMGLALGGMLASMDLSAQWPLLGMMVIMGAVVASLDFPPLQPTRKGEDHSVLEMHDLLMIGLLMAIAFRSVIWNVMNLAHSGDTDTLLWLGAGALVGKIAGGFAADWLGWRNYVLGALALAIPALAWGQDQPVLLVVGIALLQSATPVAIAAMHRALPRSPATAAGLALGLAIAIGGIPTSSQFPMDWMQWPPLLAGLGGLALLLYWFTLRKASRIQLNPHTGQETTQRKMR